MTKKTITFLLFFAISMLLVIPQDMQAMTRSEILEEIINTLELPRWTGNRRYSDVPPEHPHAKAVETALALGILHPFDRFYPDLEATRGEALMFAFQAMGWRHEARLADIFCAASPKDSNLPPYLAPYLTLATSTTPRAPEELFKFPAAPVDRNEMTLLTKWLIQCRQKILWEVRLKGKRSSLIIHREGAGSPPRGWTIQLKEFSIRKDAEELCSSLRASGLKTFVEHTDCAWGVMLGSFRNHASASLALKKAPSRFSATIVPRGRQDGNALFWAAAIVDPKEASMHIATAPALGAWKMPLSRIADLAEAEGAVNGGYFYRKSPVGTLYIDGTPVSSPFSARSAVGWNDAGEIVMGDGRFRTLLITDRGEKHLSSINSGCDVLGISLYTPHFGRFGKAIPPGAREFLVRNETIISRRRADRSNHMMGEEGFMLVAYGANSGPLEDASTAELKTEWRDPRFNSARQVIQAGPILFSPQRKFSTEKFSVNLIEERHPRTIAASDGRRLWWIVIDGRNSWHSCGASLTEAAAIASRLKMEAALNMDGGGSSELWWRGSIINMPSGGAERHLPYAIVF